MNGDIQQGSVLLNRPMSSTGLPGGTLEQNVNGSVTPVDFYIKALAGERLLLARIIINIRSATNITVNKYGDINQLTNGIQVFLYKKSLSSVVIDITNGFPIKRNEDWGKWCFDSRPIPIGPTQNTQTWQARWTLTRYGNPYGIVLEEGDYVGVRIRDNLSTLTSHTILGEGVHLGSVNPAWINVLDPQPSI